MNTVQEKIAHENLMAGLVLLLVSGVLALALPPFDLHAPLGVRTWQIFRMLIGVSGLLLFLWSWAALQLLAFLSALSNSVHYDSNN